MPKSELLILKKAMDFSKWLMHHTGKFPKSHRFTLAVRMENAILEFIEKIATANMRSQKIPLLKQADECLTRLRLLFRLSYEMRFINLKSYKFGSESIVELGKMLGGWMKNPGNL